MYGLRGMGQTAPVIPDNPCATQWAWSIPSCWSWWNPTSANVAPPPAPTGDVLTVPPASGADAQATVDALINQQTAAQQAVAAGQVQTNALDQLASGVVDTGNALSAPLGIPWLVWLVGGVGIFAMVAVGGGSPRRYGR
jgi:hypothetical protein